MASESQVAIRTGHTPSALRWSLIAGFVAFGLDIAVSYPLRGHACSADAMYQLHIVSIICFLIALSGSFTGWSLMRRLPHDKKEEGPHPYDRAHFQALLGVGFSLAFALAIVANAVPRWILNPCH
jgi:hypothetical protein